MSSGIVIDHDDHKPLSHWFNAQIKYAFLEADKIKSNCNLSWKDRLRSKILFAPFLNLFYCLFAKRLILDGWAGIFYSTQRFFAELILSLVLLDRKLRQWIGLNE
ncbi:glycosyltransferase [Rhodopirellula islandica]|uniref:Glycosyltransferase n=1 Tax=Rhodopirellula islandica TaxID=595434 RepID=A0A0J1B7Z2_RHOIS|nr:glycosyltransferase [Rhodopirellula islandica]